MFNSWLLYLYCYPFTFPYKNLSDKWLWDTFYQIKTIDVKYFNAKSIQTVQIVYYSMIHITICKYVLYFMTLISYVKLYSEHV